MQKADSSEALTTTAMEQEKEKENIVKWKQIKRMNGKAMIKRINQIEDTYSMTHAEARMVFLQLSEPGSSTYNIPFSVQFDKNINVWANLTHIIENTPILQTRFYNNKAISDVSVVIKNENEEDSSPIDVWSPFDVEKGPLCRFALNNKTNILTGCLHHSIADGRSIALLLCWIASAEVNKASYSSSDDKEMACHYSVRRYAALENTIEEQEKEKDNIVKWKQILEDTPPKLDLDFASQVQPSYSVQNVNMDKSTVSQMNEFCQEKNVSRFVFSL